MRQEFEHRLQSDLSEARARLDKLAAAQKNEYESKMRQKLKQAQVDIAEMLNCYTAFKVQLLICMVGMLHCFVLFYSCENSLLSCSSKDVAKSHCHYT